MANLDMYDMRRDKKTEPALMMKYEESCHGCDGRISFLIVEVHAASKTIRNYSGDTYSDPEQFGDLQGGRYLLTGFEYPERCSALDIEYRDKFSVNLSQAEAMVTTLRRLSRKIRRMAEELGTSDTTGEAMRRFGQALGCKWVITFDPNATHRGFGYDDNEHAYKWSTLVEAKDHVNWRVREHYAKIAAKAA